MLGRDDDLMMDFDRKSQKVFDILQTYYRMSVN